MDEYGININTGTRSSRYRSDGRDQWPLDQAVEIAFALRNNLDPIYVAIGNGVHEFRLWSERANSGHLSGFNDTATGMRWNDTAWYVDVQFGDIYWWWAYRPLATLADYYAAEELADKLGDLHPTVTKVRAGAVDGGEEHEWETQA